MSLVVFLYPNKGLDYPFPIDYLMGFTNNWPQFSLLNLWLLNFSLSVRVITPKIHQFSFAFPI